MLQKVLTNFKAVVGGHWYYQEDNKQMSQFKRETSKEIDDGIRYQWKNTTNLLLVIPLTNGSFFRQRPNIYKVFVRLDKKRTRIVEIYQQNSKTKTKRVMIRKPSFSLHTNKNANLIINNNSNNYKSYGGYQNNPKFKRHSYSQPTQPIATLNNNKINNNFKISVASNGSIISWQWKDNNDKWKDYGIISIRQIETAYVNNKMSINLQNGTNIYEISFHKMQQKNIQTGFKRDIQRIIVRNINNSNQNTFDNNYNNYKFVNYNNKNDNQSSNIKVQTSQTTQNNQNNISPVTPVNITTRTRGTTRVSQTNTSNQHLRDLWHQGSSCQIYSETHQKWFIGTIQLIYTDNGVCWLEVKFNTNTSTVNRKTVRRYGNNVKPVDTDTCNAVSPLSLSSPSQNEIDRIMENKYKLIFYDIFLKKISSAFWNALAIQSPFVEHNMGVDKNAALKIGSAVVNVGMSLIEDIPLAKTILTIFKSVTKISYDLLVLQKCAENVLHFERFYCANNGKRFATEIAVKLTKLDIISNEILQLSTKKKYKKLITKRANEIGDYLLSLIFTGYAKNFFNKSKTKQYVNVLIALIVLKNCGFNKKKKLFRNSIQINAEHLSAISDISSDLSDDDHICEQFGTFCQQFQLKDQLTSFYQALISQ